MTQAQENKAKAIEILRGRVEAQSAQLQMIDPRLFQYYDEMVQYSGVEQGDPDDRHNLMEILGAIRLLRLLRTYQLDQARLSQAIYDGEGKWTTTDGKRYKHVSGGMKQPGRQGPVVYRWEPFQIYALTSIYGPVAWIDTELTADDRELLETERINEDTGHIEDLRRLCTRFILFGPRKINKSGFGAFVNSEDFLRGDFDAQIFCTANSQDQSKILYRKTQDMLRSLDPQEKRIRFTATETNWKDGQFRGATMQALPAGGKMPDGKFASTCDADEYGSASYVNGRSDMGQTVSVIESSMGPRREPLTIITTTASLITNGPFVEMLDATHRLLLRELDYEAGTDTPTLAEDRQMCLLLEPDEWEREEEYLLTSKPLRRKINPMLGKIAQHSFYEDEIVKSRMDETKKRETISKLFNVYISGKVKEWIKPDEIRALQTKRRIDECTRKEGWMVYCGMDFSKGDDLNGNSYLAVRWSDELQEYEFFADMDAYMSEEAVNESPIRDLLLKWAAEGWLHIVPGKTFDPAVVVGRIMELDEKDINFFGFGYDRYNAKNVVNALTQWAIDLNLDPKQLIKPVQQNYATYSPAVKEFDYMVRRCVQDPDGKTIHDPMVSFSDNPLWPWEFGNCQLAESNDGMENLKPIKANDSASCKVDNIQMLLSALILHDQAEVDLH